MLPPEKAGRGRKPVAAPKKPGKPAKGNRVVHECCGSKISRHKASCAENEKGGNLPPDDEPERRQSSLKGAKVIDLKCIDCDLAFQASSLRGCPSCGGKSVQK